MSIGKPVDLKKLEIDHSPILARMQSEEPACLIHSLDVWLVTKWNDLMRMGAHLDVSSAKAGPYFLAEALGPNMQTKGSLQASRAGRTQHE